MASSVKEGGWRSVFCFGFVVFSLIFDTPVFTGMRRVCWDCALLQFAVVDQPYFAKANRQGDAIISPASL